MLIGQIIKSSEFNMGLSIMGFLIMIPILVALLQESGIKRPETKLLFYAVFCHAIVCITNVLSWMYNGMPEQISLMRALDTCSFSFALIGFFCFMRYEIFILQKSTFISDWVVYFVAFMCGTAVILMLVGNAQPQPWFWGYNENGGVYITAYFGIPYLFPFIVMIFGIGLTWSCRDFVTDSEILSLLGYFLFPIIGGLFDIVLGSSLIYSMSSIMILMLYANIHTDVMRREVTNEKELAQSNAKLMVSQIQPHFMYNSLNSIYYLIEQDPELAQEAVCTFSDYLRQNVNSLRNDSPVLFSEEIGHTQAYLYLEKLRFGDQLDVEFDIQADDFVVPALSVQPLVENAVKHGITQKEGKGKLTISSREFDTEYIVTISDDGIGFNLFDVKDSGTHTHIGIQNVRSRIENMIGGKLYVKSSPGKGTVCTVIIPKEGENKEGNNNVKN